MTNFSSTLKELRKSRGLTQQELTEVLNDKYGTNFNKGMISKWENGKEEPRMDSMRYIVDYFNVSLDNILGISTNEVYEYKLKANNDLVVKESSTPYITNTINLPLYERVSAGALAMIDGVTQDNVEHISLSSHFLGKHANSNGLFSMYVNGDSMNKVINHGEIVIAKKLELNEYQDGDIVIFSHNGEYSLKRYAPNEVENFILFKAESHNISFKDIVIPKDTMCELKIYGKVIFCGSTF